LINKIFKDKNDQLSFFNGYDHTLTQNFNQLITILEVKILK